MPMLASGSGSRQNATKIAACTHSAIAANAAGRARSPASRRVGSRAASVGSTTSGAALGRARTLERDDVAQRSRHANGRARIRQDAGMVAQRNHFAAQFSDARH